MSWFQTLPLPVIGGALTVALLLAKELGYLLKGLTVKANTPPEEAGSGYLLTSVIGLLGLLVAFTFSMASDRYDQRRALVVAEANALSTAYLRVQFLEPTWKAQISPLMVQYGRARLDFFGAGEDRKALARSDADTANRQALIWSGLTQAMVARPQATLNPVIVSATNELFDLASSRRALMDAHVPDSILRALIVYALVTAGILGYGLAREGHRHTLASAAFFLLLAMAISLIIDLDRPRTGSVQISQAALIQTVKDIEALERKRLATMD